MKQGLAWAIGVACPMLAVASSCVPGAQTAAGYPLINAVCGVQWSGFVSSTGNDGNKFDIYYIAADGLNAANIRPIELWVHGGAFVKTYEATDPSWTGYFSARATAGAVVIVPGYTVDTLYSLAAQMNAGASTATITLSAFSVTECAQGYTLAGLSGLPFNVGSDTITVTSAMPACDNANHTVNITGATNTVANGTPMYYTPIGLPAMTGDLAGLLAFLAHCAPGGASYNAGTCAGITNVGGDPKQIRLLGVSAGAQLTTWLMLQGKCNRGVTCTFLNNTPGTPGYHEFSDTGWSVQNSAGVAMVGASIASLTGRTRGLSSTFQAQDTMMTGNGDPTCTSGYDNVALACSNPTAAYTTSLAQDILTTMQAGGTMPVTELSQAGSLDGDFYKWEVLLGGYAQFPVTVYALNHALDYLGHTPATSMAFKEATAALGVNPCTQIMGNGCPAPSQVNAGGVF